MRIAFNGYDVEIKARRGDRRCFNAADTHYLLNWFCSFAYEAAKQYDRDGAFYLAKLARATASEIYEALETGGAYKFK